MLSVSSGSRLCCTKSTSASQPQPCCSSLAAGRAEGKDRRGQGHMLATLEGTEPCWPPQQHGGNTAWGWECGWDLRALCWPCAAQPETPAAPQVLG